jgi:hypothetical protein
LPPLVEHAWRLNWECDLVGLWPHLILVSPVVDLEHPVDEHADVDVNRLARF